MKVLLIGNYPAPYRVELNNLIAEKVELTEVYGVKEDTTRDSNYQNDNIKYNAIWVKNGIRVGTRSCISFDIIKIIKKGNFDVIIVGEYASPMSQIAMTYLKKHKIPFLFNADGGFIKQDSTIKHKIKTHFLSMPTAWLTSGPFSKQYLVHYGACENRIYYYPFAFNYSSERQLINAEQKQLLKQKLGISEQKAILYVGRTLPVKRLDMILKAYAKVKGNVGLYIVGVQKLPNEYNEIIEQNNIKNVHVVGFKYGQELKDYYLASDTFVLFSESEVWGLVINEAMTNACPPIVSDSCIAGIELIKDGKNGVLVESGNVDKLATAMQNMIDDDNFRQKIAENCYQSMENFNIENNAKTHLEIINDFYNNYVIKQK